VFKTFDEAHEMIRKEGFRIIDLEFSDLWGRWHHVTIPASQFNEHLMRDGVGFDGSSVGLKSVKPCDALEADHDFLLAGDVIDADQLADYIHHLRANDAAVRNRPHPFEVGKYVDV
jgi:glutamine synthetase